MIWTPRTTVAALIERDGRFLMVEENIGGQLQLNQPAGHLEDGESLIEAVIRETREETAWSFTPRALVGIYRWRHPLRAETYLRFAFCGEAIDHDATSTLDADIHRALWLSPDEIMARQAVLRSPLVLQCLQDYLSGQRYSLNILHN